MRDVTLRVLDAISERAWDNLGIVFGSGACLAIVHQILHEWSVPGRSTVSIWFVGGFFAVYLFWFFYGLRFRRRAIWLPNGMAALLQIVFAALILAKS